MKGPKVARVLVSRIMEVISDDNTENTMDSTSGVAREGGGMISETVAMSGERTSAAGKTTSTFSAQNPSEPPSSSTIDVTRQGTGRSGQLSTSCGMAIGSVGGGGGPTGVRGKSRAGKANDGGSTRSRKGLSGSAHVRDPIAHQLFFDRKYSNVLCDAIH